MTAQQLAKLYRREARLWWALSVSLLLNGLLLVHIITHH